MPTLRRGPVLLLSILWIQGCTPSSSRHSLDLNFVFHEATELSIDVFYEEGAEPLVGNTTGGKPFWEITQDNLDAIFEDRTPSVQVKVPTTLGEMHALEAQNQSSWTLAEIEALATQHAIKAENKTQARIFVVWLRGYLEKNGEAQTSILGVSLSGTSIVAIFKDVIESGSSSETSIVARYLEQSTLVHELGHALGLVNGGVPMQSEHEDPNQGHHCSNDSCVLYWQNAGAADLIDFIRRMIVTGGNTILYDDACLQDWKSF